MTAAFPSAPTPFHVPRFYPILDTAVLRSRQIPVMELANTLVDAGVRILQYRHKDGWTEGDYQEAAAIRTLCHDNGVLFVINDRADYAKLLGAALHIGQEDLPPTAARRIVSDEVIGFSTHNRAQLQRADAEPVEYLSIGPIFSTTSKQNPDPVVGVAGLSALRPLTGKPLVAIGGITAGNASEVLSAGANSVAVISGILPDEWNRKLARKFVVDWMTLTA
jgi:thiamine-phosphate pyrophosphorylase